MNNKYRKYILLERYLNKFRFHDIPLGSVIADQYILVGINGVPNGKKLLRNFFAEIVYLMKSIIRRNRVISFNSILVTRISDKVHIKNLMLPLIKNLMPDITVIENPGVSKNNLDYHTISVKETFNTPIKYFFSIFVCFHEVCKHVIKNKRKLQLTQKESIYYLICIFHQLRILAFYDNQFRYKKNQPRIIIVGFDRNSIASPLILAANKHKTPTVTLVHGVVNNYGYAPVLAEKIFCFGEIQKQQLINQGVSENKIVITGSSIIDTPLKSQIANKKPNIPFVVCLGISPYGSEKIKYIIDICSKAVEENEGYKFLIKLHPSQKMEEFKHYETEKIQVLSSTSIQNTELFSHIDLLIVHNSGLGVEAAMAGVPVAVFDIPGLDLGMGQIMVEYGGFELLKTSNEISKYIDWLKIKHNFSVENKKSIDFANKFYYSTGAKASETIIENIVKILNDKN